MADGGDSQRSGRTDNELADLYHSKQKNIKIY